MAVGTLGPVSMRTQEECQMCADTWRGCRSGIDNQGGLGANPRANVSEAGAEGRAACPTTGWACKRRTRETVGQAVPVEAGGTSLAPAMGS